MNYKNIINKNIVISMTLIALSACSAAPKLESEAIEPRVQISKELGEDAVANSVSDPWEGFNRRMYYFNAKADEYVMLPIVKGYKAVTPDFVETGVKNFFNNLGEISTFVNSLLQFKLDSAAETFGRFVFNSTLGVAGLFDVASPMGLDEQNEDFGQTLGAWGVSPGPYLVLPLLGPSNVRDATGTLVDTAIYSEAIDQAGLKDEEAMFLNLLKSIDARAGVSFTYYSTGSAFEYEQVRLFYTKYRELQIDR